MNQDEINHQLFLRVSEKKYEDVEYLLTSNQLKFKAQIDYQGEKIINLVCFHHEYQLLDLIMACCPDYVSKNSSNAVILKLFLEPEIAQYLLVEKDLKITHTHLLRLKDKLSNDDYQYIVDMIGKKALANTLEQTLDNKSGSKKNKI